jgi:transcriptional regulator with XRE-family HTH domain
MVDDLRVGSVVRAVRRRRGLRQADVARLAGVAQSSVSRLERGHLERVGLPTARKTAAALQISLAISPRWRGGELPRLLDKEHASCVEQVATSLGPGWEVLLEYSFNYFGERGSVDVLGWQRDRAALLLVEVKSQLVDLQDLFAGLGRKRRIVPRLLQRDRGWSASHLGVVVALPDTSRNRHVVATHARSFDAALPDRNVSVRSWAKEPSGALAGLWFLRRMPPRTVVRTPGGPTRVFAANRRRAAGGR